MSDKIQDSFNLTLKNSNLQNIVSDFAELSVDSILQEGVLKDIPIVSTLISLTKVGISINDKLFLKKMKLEPNRSTIYRELKFLVANNIIVKNIISGISYYEISPSYRNFQFNSLEARKTKKEGYIYNKNSSHNQGCSSQLNQGCSHQDHHHHHLICLKCNKIIKVEMTNQLVIEEKRLAKKNNFNIVNHSLDFYGYCQKCQA